VLQLVIYTFLALSWSAFTSKADLVVLGLHSDTTDWVDVFEDGETNQGINTG
jgi:hypothetical protein